MNGETLRIERTFRAPAERVFDAWTNEEVLLGLLVGVAMCCLRSNGKRPAPSKRFGGSTYGRSVWFTTLEETD